MDIGVMLPVWAASITDSRQNVALAVEAERLGFESVWLGDHLVQPPHLSAFGGAGQLEALTMMGAIAVSTESVRVGTCVLIPLRHPIHVRSAFATLANLAPGRIVLGAGGGVLEPEFRALEVDYARRGARLDETLSLMRDWPQAEQLPEFMDEGGWHFLPRPDPRIELWIGGSVTVGSKPLRRAASFGDGWFPAYPTVDAYARANQRLNGQLDSHGRARGEVRRSALFWCCIDEDAERARAASRQYLCAHYERSQSVKLDAAADRAQGVDDVESIVASKQLVGGVDDVTERLQSYRDAGMDHAVIGFLPVADSAKSMRLFAEKVMPRLASNHAASNGAER